VGVVPCSSSTYPQCGGTCSGGAVCSRVSIYESQTGGMSFCTCLDPAADCSGSFQGATCPGVCPAGLTCYGEPEPAGLGNCLGCLPECVFGIC
jgi:hypothetical protein